MTRYSEERAAAVIETMMPPHYKSIPELSKETGISGAMLYNWRQHFRLEGYAVPADSREPEKWSSADKLAVVVETASMNEAEFGEYCYQNGLYPEQIATWREACLQANAAQAVHTRQDP